LGLVFLISGFSALPLQTALAQTQAGSNAALSGAVQGQAQGQGQQNNGMNGLGGAAARPGFQQPGMAAPGMLPRPDFGARDAQRNNLSPLRAPNTSPQPVSKVCAREHGQTVALVWRQSV
jgi:hypothetical protein